MINLLPPNSKHRLKGEERVRLVAIFSTLSALSLISLSLLLLAIRFYLAGQTQAQKELLDIQKQELSTRQALIGEIKNINENARNIHEFYDQQLKASDVLERISRALPANVYLTSFSYVKQTGQKAAGKISLGGFAPTRTDLVLFKDNLQQDPFFSRIVLPLGPALDITFSLSAEVKTPPTQPD